MLDPRLLARLEQKKLNRKQKLLGAVVSYGFRNLADCFTELE